MDGSEKNRVALNHRFEYKNQWQLDNAFIFYSWIKSRHFNKYYLMRNPKRLKNVVGITLFLVLTIFALIFCLSSFPIWLIAGGFICICIFSLLILACYLRRVRTFPFLPLAIIDLEHKFIRFDYRNKLACSQSPGLKLQIPFDCLKQIDLVHTRIINDGVHNMRMVVGYGSWKAIYLNYQYPNSAPQRDLVFVGMGLGYRILTPIANAGKIPLEETFEDMICFRN